MVSGMGGLNIKDYPFAFSVAALIFSPIELSSDVQIPIIFVITIFGGMIGSILIITNPIGNLIRLIFIGTTRGMILQSVKINKFLETVYKKNYNSAISSPSISFEINKIVGMFYFTIVLSIAAYRILFDANFTKILNLGDNLTLITFLTIAGLIGVILALIINVSGFRSVSLLTKIKSVTIMLLSGDLTRLSILSTRGLQYFLFNSQPVLKEVNSSLSKLDLEKTKEVKFKEKFDDSNIRNTVPTAIKIKYDKQKILARCWNYFKIIKEISEDYNIKKSVVILWFNNTQFVNTGESLDSIGQLQSAIDSRDWQNSKINSVRILDQIIVNLNQKYGFNPEK